MLFNIYYRHIQCEMLNFSFGKLQGNAKVYLHTTMPAPHGSVPEVKSSTIIHLPEGMIFSDLQATIALMVLMTATLNQAGNWYFNLIPG